MLKYRPEIDGLRAVAVLLVLIYHADISFHDKEILPGGFLGVDIFFVISGYLITKIIAYEIESNSFSIWNFYERRVRRIVPALTLVIGVTSYFCWQHFDQEAFVEFGNSIVASVLFVANVFFYFQDSYNAEVSSLKPLLHLWSLGVEEQFYIFYPMLLLLLAKTKRSNLILAALFTLSLIYSEWYSHVNQKFNFFMLPTRAWELLAGGIAAKYEYKVSQFVLPKPISELLSLVSISVILLYAVALTDESRLPSLITLPLIASSIYILLFGRQQQNLVGRILSSSPFVFVGLVSYSLYLWHMPTLVLFRVITNRFLSNVESVLALSLSFILAVVSYYLVETPVRKRHVLSRKLVFSGTFAIFFVFSLLGWSVHVNEGYPSRFLSLQNIIIDVRLYLKSKKKDGHKSFAESNGVTVVDDKVHPKHYILNGGNGYTLITAGDSHMATLTTAIIERSPEFIHKFYPCTRPGLVFLLNGLARTNHIDIIKNARTMEKRNNKTFDIISKSENPIVILGGRLPLLLEHSGFDNKNGGKERRKINPGFVIDKGNGFREATIPEVKAAYQDTISKLLNTGCKVVLVYPIPEVGWDVPKTVLKKTKNMNSWQVSNYFSDKTNLSTSYDVFKDRTKSAYDVLDSVKSDRDLIRVYPEEFICEGNYCFTYDDVLFYRDDNHLSHQGAIILYEHIISNIKANWGDDTSLLFSADDP